MSDIEAALRPLVAKLVDEALAKREPANDVGELTVAAYCIRHSLSESTVRGAIRDERLEHHRIGRMIRIPADARITAPVRDATARARLKLMGR